MPEIDDVNEHNFIKPTAIDPHSYEIMVRKRGVNDYASYCPQLNVIIKGVEQDEVKIKMREYIAQYIKELDS